ETNCASPLARCPVACNVRTADSSDSWTPRLLLIRRLLESTPTTASVRSLLAVETVGRTSLHDPRPSLAPFYSRRSSCCTAKLARRTLHNRAAPLTSPVRILHQQQHLAQLAFRSSPSLRE